MSGAANQLDLTGQWHGTYAYPQGIGLATPFLANIVETDGSFSGIIIEPDVVYELTDTLQSEISGHRGDRSVDFTKTYHGQTYGYENPVDYVGQLSSDGRSVTGVWSLKDLDGTFEMFREDAMEEAQKIVRAAAIPEKVD